MRKHTESERLLLEQSSSARDAFENAQLLEELGVMLRALRHEAGMSQQQLQAITGVHQADISRMENGAMDREPNLAMLRKIANATGYRVVIGLRKVDAKDVRPRFEVEI